MTDDIRWKQRFDNFQRALQTLMDADALAKTRALSALEEQGVIQSFEFTHEVAWNVLKDYLEYQGIMGIVGSRDAVREAFKRGLIDNGDVWMHMIYDRNKTSHTYDQKTAQEIVTNIFATYLPAFMRMEQAFTTLSEQSENA